MKDMTRFQILFDNKKDGTTENFTVAQRKQFLARVKELKAKGIVITTWDTRKNALSRLFRF